MSSFRDLVDQEKKQIADKLAEIKKTLQYVEEFVRLVNELPFFHEKLLGITNNGYSFGNGNKKRIGMLNFQGLPENFSTNTPFVTVYSYKERNMRGAFLRTHNLNIRREVLHLSEDIAKPLVTAFIELEAIELTPWQDAGTKAIAILQKIGINMPRSNATEETN